MAFEVTNLAIRRGYEGPQLVLSWDYPVPDVLLSQGTGDTITGFGRLFSQKIGQVFQLAQAGEMRAVRFRVYGSGTPTDGLKASIWTVSGGFPNTKIADSINEISGENLTLAPPVPAFNDVADIEFEFADTVPLAATTDYAFVIERTGSLDDTNYYIIFADTGLSGAIRFTGSWGSLPQGLYLRLLGFDAPFEFKIRRALFDYPATITDGVEVYSGADLNFVDLAVERMNTYYYTVFTLINGTDYSSIFSQIHETVHDGTLYYQKLWNRLVEVYRDRDRETDQLPLLELAGSDGERFNFNEDPFVEWGQLYRFLKLFGLELGTAREFIEYYSEFYNVSDVNINILPLLADYVGLKLTDGIGIARQRFLIQNAIFLYQIRGTLDGIIDFATGIVGLVPIITEFTNNLLRSNTIDSEIVDFTDVSSYGTPTDSLDRITEMGPDDQWTIKGLGLWFSTDYTNITAAQLTLMEQYFDDFIPGTVAWFVFAQDGGSPTGWRQIYP